MSYGGVAPVPTVSAGERRAPSWWPVGSSVIIGVVVLCCLGWVWAAVTHADFEMLLILPLFLVLTGLVWAVWSISGLLMYRVGWISLVVPLVVVFTVGLLSSGLPERLGWRLSESGLEQAARACDPADGNRRIGMYSISTIKARDNGCLLTVPGMGVIMPAGYAYMPAGEPPAASGEYDESYTHLEGPWYRFTN
ncbi:hypothetical protein ACFWU5_25280 [Nocardia sp. NPDC058640]|uniref:hypothetical protein n=1 Tax=Nocardia sp. NPDC058640 TaxID=3346571 RepID=UPI003646AD3C